MLLQRNAKNVCATRRRRFDMCLATSLKTVISPDQQDCPVGSSEQMKYTTEANRCLCLNRPDFRVTGRRSMHVRGDSPDPGRLSEFVHHEPGMLDMTFMSARIARNHFDCLIMSGSRLTRSIHRPHLQRQIAPTAWISSFLCTFPIPRS